MKHSHSALRGSLLGAGLGTRLALAAAASTVLWATVLWALA